MVCRGAGRPPCSAVASRMSMGPGAEQDEAERLIRCLQVAQLFRGSCHAVTNAASSALALQLCQGDGQRVVRLLSLALTLSGLVELGMSPWVGMICDRYGRKPLLIVGGLLRVIP